MLYRKLKYCAQLSKKQNFQYHTLKFLLEKEKHVQWNDVEF